MWSQFHNDGIIVSATVEHTFAETVSRLLRHFMSFSGTPQLAFQPHKDIMLVSPCQACPIYMIFHYRLYIGNTLIIWTPQTSGCITGIYLQA